MKMKIQALYLTGAALLIGAAGVGDSVTFDTVGSWTGAVILAVLLAAALLAACSTTRRLGVWPGARDRAGGKGAAAPVLPEAEELPESGRREERQA